MTSSWDVGNCFGGRHFLKSVYCLNSIPDLFWTYPNWTKPAKCLNFTHHCLLIPLFFLSQKKKGFICVPGRHQKDEAPPYHTFNFFKKIQLPGCSGAAGWTVQRTLRCVPSPPTPGSICAGNNLLGCCFSRTRTLVLSWSSLQGRAGLCPHRCWGVSRASAQWCPALHSPHPVSLSSALSQERHFCL